MPEEINRILTDQLSDILFTTSPEAKDNLINEGKTKDQIFFVGNTMIDSLVKFNNHSLNVNQYLINIEQASTIYLMKYIFYCINITSR